MNVNFIPNFHITKDVKLTGGISPKKFSDTEFGYNPRTTLYIPMMAPFMTVFHKSMLTYPISVYRYFIY